VFDRRFFRLLLNKYRDYGPVTTGKPLACQVLIPLAMLVTLVKPELMSKSRPTALRFPDRQTTTMFLSFGISDSLEFSSPSGMSVA